MKLRIVPADELSTRTLRAKDYVLKKFKLTITEETEKDVIIHLDAEDEDEAWTRLTELSDSDLMALIRKGKQKDYRVLARDVSSLEETDEDT